MPSGVVTPGTISKAMPASAKASASSPPRPKMNGSPPLSRTTVRPRRARSMSMADFLLRVGVARFLLSDVNALGVGRGKIEQGRIREVVVEYGVGTLEDRAA